MCFKERERWHSARSAVAAHQDVLLLDRSIRETRGRSKTLYVFSAFSVTFRDFGLCRSPTGGAKATAGKSGNQTEETFIITLFSLFLQICGLPACLQ